MKKQVKKAISDGYLRLIHNYYRFWLDNSFFFFGASPAICGSFLKVEKPILPFENTPKGAKYLPYATSLRLSDLRLYQ